MADYYSILGISKDSPDDEIKKAYRKLAMKHHPDRGGDATEFQKIQEAYATLSDSQKRQQYDNPQPQFNSGFGGGMPPGFEDVINQMFGGGNPFGFGGRQQPQRNQNINLSTSISLEDAFYGKEVLAEINLPAGRMQSFTIKIPPGVNNGMSLRLRGLGDDTYPNQPRGDIHLNVNIFDHPEFSRQGDDLIKPVEISCIDAMLGCKINVKTIDGKNLEVTINPGTQHGQILSANQYGMPNVNNTAHRGRLLMPIKVNIPTNLTSSQKDLLSKFNNI